MKLKKSGKINFIQAHIASNILEKEIPNVPNQNVRVENEENNQESDDEMALGTTSSKDDAADSDS